MIPFIIDEKMKRIYNIIMIPALAFLLAGCDLTLVPEDRVTPETYFKTATDLELWSNHYYYALLDNGDNTARINADDMVDKSMGSVIQGTRLPSDKMDGANEWNWSELRKINYQLEHSSNCSDEAARTQYDGVAYFFRAYFYYQKVLRFGDVPWYDKVLDSTDEEFLKKPREDRGVIMDHVMEDLDRAIEMLPSGRDVSRVTKWTALALKSRAALYEGTWRKYRNLPDADKYLEQAAESAGEFIKSSGYVLKTDGEEPYRNLFCADDADASEVILARIYNFEILNLSNSIQFNVRNDAQGFTRRFLNHYLMADGSRFTDRKGYETMTYVDEVKDRDPRLAQTVLCPGYVQKDAGKPTLNDMTSMTGYEPIKFVSSASHSGASKGTLDWPLFRAAEVYLNYAEALAELGRLTQDDLDKSVNVIRDRARMPHLIMDTANQNPDAYLESCYPNVNDGSYKGVILEIRRERTVELVNEGFRQWDMFRWKEGAQMVNSTHRYYGMWFPAPGLYDMDGDGKNDLEIYKDVQQSKPSDGLTVKKIGSDIFLSEGDWGYVEAWQNLTYEWDEERDYLWPIPADQRVLTGGALTQNPGWKDSTNL